MIFEYCGSIPVYCPADHSLGYSEIFYDNGCFRSSCKYMTDQSLTMSKKVRKNALKRVNYTIMDAIKTININIYFISLY